METSTDRSRSRKIPTDIAEHSSNMSTAGDRRRASPLVMILVATVLAGIGVGAWQFLTADVGSVRHNYSAGSTSAALSDAEASQRHPLWPILQFADQLEKNDSVHDYTATLLKQERINGVLRPEEIAFVKIRNRPLSVYMNFLAPPNQTGTEAIYVEGANNGKLIGHAGTLPKSLAGSLWLPPTGLLAMQDQRYPITEMGIANLARRLIEVGQHDIHYGECYVWRHDNAKVGDRPCISFTVVHPFKRTGFSFHIARIFIDKELMVPVHYESYDWPDKPGDPPPLLERYTYTNLKMNPGLTDADFDPKNPEYHFGL
jgi:hypothetical protein